MNYFSHFWVDGKENDHFYNTGLILPDFARTHVKSFHHPPLFHNQNHSKLHSGCLSHYRADKAFHQSPFFKGLLEQTSRIMNAAPFSALLKRKWFLSHILVELMLDRLLVKDNLSVLDAFYLSLNKVSDNELGAFLHLFQGVNIDAFTEKYNHFRSVQYIYFYVDNIKFVYSLNRIMMRAGAGELSQQDQDVLLQVVLELEQQLSLQIPELFNQLKLSIHG